MLVDDFNFELPTDLIAQEPAEDRSAARLLLLPRGAGCVAHRTMADLPDALRAGDLLVVNDSRVFPARLLGRREPSGGAVECLLISRIGGSVNDSSEECWEALMHPGQKLKPGAHVSFGGSSSLRAEVLERRFHGRRVIRLWTGDASPLAGAIDAVGHVPLPPYIRRPDRLTDHERYQTMFARQRGSVAAPTAGLHFDPPLVAALRARGVELAAITLHVGYGTFQPVRAERVADHRLEPERYSISTDTAAMVDRKSTRLNSSHIQKSRMPSSA